MCMVVFLKESDSSLAKPDKIKFLNEPKLTELAKQKHGVNTIHQQMCDLWHHSQQLCSTFFFKKTNVSTEHSI